MTKEVKKEAFKQLEILGYLIIESSIGTAIVYFNGIDWVWTPFIVAFLVQLGKVLTKWGKEHFEHDPKDFKS